MDQFRAEIQKEDADHTKKKLSEDGYNVSRGYGGKFGVETDRMDKSAVGHDYQVCLLCMTWHIFVLVIVVLLQYYSSAM